MNTPKPQLPRRHILITVLCSGSLWNATALAAESSDALTTPAPETLEKRLATQEETLKQDATKASKEMIETIAEERSDPTRAKAVLPSRKVETKVVTLYTTTENYCAFQMQALAAKRSIARHKNARINAYGGALALLGGVAAYAPVKAVLMGVGISSSGGSDSILGHMASNWSDEETTATGDIAALRANYKAGVDSYNAIAPTDDLFGTKRFNILTQIRAACDGLSALQATTQ